MAEPANSPWRDNGNEAEWHTRRHEDAAHYAREAGWWHRWAAIYAKDGHKQEAENCRQAAAFAEQLAAESNAAMVRFGGGADRCDDCGSAIDHDHAKPES